MRVAGYCAALGAAALAVYSNTFSNPFVYDDKFTIVDNPHLRSLLPLERSLTGPAGSGSSGRPIVALSLALNYALGGLSVVGYHIFNLAVHVLAGWTLFGVVRRTLLSAPLVARFGGVAAPLAFCLVLTWLLHPLQTAAINHVTYRNELLAGLFLLLTFYAVIRGSQSQKGRLWYATAVGACILGMASKEVMAGAPILVLLFDVIFLTAQREGTLVTSSGGMSSSLRAVLRRRWGLYAGLVATWALLALLVATAERGRSVGIHFKDVQPLDYARTQLAVVVHYLRLAFWPHPLAFDYWWPVAKSLQPVLLQAMLIAVLGVATVVGLWRRSPLGFLGAWFFLILAPSSSFVPITGSIAAEHRMYLPLVAPLSIAIVGGFSFLRRLARPLALQRWGGAALTISLAVALGTTTLRRNADYHNEATLWLGALTVEPDNPRAHNILGAVLAMQGKLDEAKVHYLEALRVMPDYPRAHFNMGTALVQEGKLNEAVAEYEAVLRLLPDDSEAHSNLANVLVRQGKLDEALEHLNTAVRTNPGNAMALLNMAQIQIATGKINDGIVSIHEALRLRPDLANLSVEIIQPFVQAHHGLALRMLQQGRYREAVDEFRVALVLDPEHATSLNNLAWLLATCPDDGIRSGEEAVRCAERASQEPTRKSDPELLDTLAAAYAEAGRFDAAVATAERAHALATAAGHLEKSRKLELRLELYRAHRPYRMPVPRSPAHSSVDS